MSVCPSAFNVNYVDVFYWIRNNWMTKHSVSILNGI